MKIYITGDCKASELNLMKKKFEKEYNEKIEFDLSPFLNIEYDEKLKSKGD